MAPPFMTTAAGKTIWGIGDALLALLGVVLMRRLWLCFGVLVGGRKQRDYKQLNEAVFDTHTIADVKMKVSTYKYANDENTDPPISCSNEPSSARALAGRGYVASRAAGWMTRHRPAAGVVVRSKLTGSPDHSSSIRSALREVESKGFGIGMATKRGFKSARNALYSVRGRVRI